MQTLSSLLKTSYGMGKRFEYAATIFGNQKLFNLKDEKEEASLKAISIVYGVSRRIAKYYKGLIMEKDRLALLKLRNRIGLD